MPKIDCKYYAQQMLDFVEDSPKRGKLAIIMVGSNPASEAYVKGKLKDAEYCGVDAEVIRYPEDISQNEIMMKIAKLNWDSTVAGIIIQLPLPKHLDEDAITSSVAPIKDVDGFTAHSKYKPCTPEAILWLMEQELGYLEGKDVLIVGRGKLIGKPLIKMLLDANCTITICHSKTRASSIVEQLYYTPHHCIIFGVGIAEHFNISNAKADLIIDAGITKNQSGKLKGDCYGGELGDFDYTPVPGGIGLLTRAILMRHMVDEA